jgi:hypothetical protein
MKLIGLVLLVALTAVLVVGDMLFAGRNEPNVIPVPALILTPFGGASTTNEVPRAIEE